MELPLMGNQIVSYYLTTIQDVMKFDGFECRSSLALETVTVVRKGESTSTYETTERTRQRLTGSLWAFDSQGRARIQVEVNGDTQHPYVLRVRIVAFAVEQFGCMHKPFGWKDVEFTLQPPRNDQLAECITAIKDACRLEIAVEA